MKLYHYTRNTAWREVEREQGIVEEQIKREVVEAWQLTCIQDQLELMDPTEWLSLFYLTKKAKPASETMFQSKSESVGNMQQICQ
jgi:hypothetical protein